MSHKFTEALIEALTERWASLRTRTAADLYQIRLDLPFEGPLARLLSTPSTRKVYWQSRDAATEYVGLGMAIEVTASDPQEVPAMWRDLEARIHQGDTPVRLYGGAAFDAARPPDALWHPMGLMRFWVPQVAVQRDGDRLHWVISTAALEDASHDEIVQLIKAALQPRPEPGEAWPRSLNSSMQPTRSQWSDRVTTVIPDLIQARGKVVLSARESHTCDRSVESSHWFQSLRSQSPGGFQYFFQVGDLAFMGVSPECLYERHGMSLTTEALAGTAKLKGGLLDTHKENREHDFVIRDMAEALAKVCTDVRCDSTKERLAWQDLVHLKTALQGTLKTDVTDTQIVRALHPSAAVLGYPRDKAWQWLSTYEDHARGWYAGPVGWLDRNHAQFAVAIRCVLVVSHSIHFYAGAGLVQESQPLEEWQEVKNKMQHFKKILRLNQTGPIKS